MIIHSKNRENQVAFPLSITNDPALSWKAKGLLLVLWTHPHASFREIRKASSDGVTSIQTGFKELQKHGYVKLVRLPPPGINGVVGSRWELVREKVESLMRV